MTSRIVAIPVFAAIWLGQPAQVGAHQEPDVSTTVTAHTGDREARPRIATPRVGDAVGGQRRAPAMDDQRRGGGGGRGSGGGAAGGGSRSGGGQSSGGPPRGGNRGAGPGNGGPRGGGQGTRQGPPPGYSRPRPGYPGNVHTYARPYYARPYYPRPIYSPGYYDRWARGVYGWSPLAYAPWAWIYGTAGYAGFGFSYAPYASYGTYGVYGGYYGSYSPYLYYGHPATFDTGGVRLKVRPSDAQVFVDGYYAGLVDDFDGSFQSLRLEQGGHKIEIRMPGYETFEFDVHVQPDRTVVLKEDLRPRP